MKYCAVCHLEIKENYYSYLDNYLQIKYFDSADCNIFCSVDCAINALMLTELENEDFKKEESERLGIPEEEQ